MLGLSHHEYGTSASKQQEGREIRPATRCPVPLFIPKNTIAFSNQLMVLGMEKGMYAVGPQKLALAAIRFMGQQYAGLAVICRLMGFTGRRWLRAVICRLMGFITGRRWLRAQREQKKKKNPERRR